GNETGGVPGRKTAEFTARLADIPCGDRVVPRELPFDVQVPFLDVRTSQMILSDGPPKAVDRIGKGKRIGIDIGRRRHCADGAERVAQHSVLKRAVSTRE